MTEFTGERVIPGQVEPDLWAEHIARYAFAERFVKGRRVLDAGCGSGYGCCALAPHARSVFGIDIAPEAIAFAGEHSSAPKVSYARASVSAMPFASASFDVVTVFEVIEHLADWRNLLAEVRRILNSDGMLFVSTPNRIYYAESRSFHGPNPFHVHEFEYEEFRSALHEYFPRVQILFQNRLECFAFHGEEIVPPVEAHLGSIRDEPSEAHFFLGVCAVQQLPDLRTFLYVPRAANVLREREKHIHLLEAELRQSKQWLDRLIADHDQLQHLHEDLTLHLEEKNRWARELEQNWKASQERIVQLQEEFRDEQARAATVATGYARKVAELEDENRAKTAWAIDTENRLTAELAARGEQLTETVRRLDSAEASVIERTEWAQRLDRELTHVRAQLDTIRQSRWFKLGRAFGVNKE